MLIYAEIMMIRWFWNGTKPSSEKILSSAVAGWSDRFSPRPEVNFYGSHASFALMIYLWKKRGGSKDGDFYVDTMLETAINILNDQSCQMISAPWPVVFEKLGVTFRSLLTPLRCGTQWPHGWQHWRRRENRCRRRTRSGKRKTSPTCSAVAAWFRNQLWRVFRGRWVGTLRKAGRALVDWIIYLYIYIYINTYIYIHIYICIHIYIYICGYQKLRTPFHPMFHAMFHAIFRSDLRRPPDMEEGDLLELPGSEISSHRQFIISRFDVPMICPSECGKKSIKVPSGYLTQPWYRWP